jgi:hypothetical protein
VTGTAGCAPIACTTHMDVPPTSVTASTNRPDGRHGAHQPNGSPARADTTRSSRPRHTRRMPWSNTSRRSDRYGREHRAQRARAMAALRRAGSGVCAEHRCVKRSRLITPDMDLHLCHDRTTGQVRGLGHAACNLTEAARYANRRQQQLRRAGTPRRRTTRQSALRW